MSRLDLLLFHAWHLADDPLEQELMRPFPPLGLQYLAAWMRRSAVASCEVHDATFEPGPETFFQRCAELDPRVVGLYGHTVTRPVALPMLARCRAEGRRVVAGGPDPVQYLDEYLDGGAEVVVIGEGEHTLAELMEHLKAHDWRWDYGDLAKVRGIAFRREGCTVRTEPRPLIRPLDSLPWPERGDVGAYFAAWRRHHRHTALSMVTSRGCPFHCTWCSKQVYGDTFRRRSVDDVVGELLDLRQRYDPDQLWFADDMFTINKRWVREFAGRMRELGGDLPFYAIGRPEMLSDDICLQLAKAGLFRLYVSAESGAQHVLDAMRKDEQIGQIYRGAAMLREHGIELGVFVMLGYPGETRRDVDATLRMLHRLQPDVTLVSVAHPMKGTAFYERVSDRLDPSADVGGRLGFRMRYPRPFYASAQRLIWAETGMVRKLRRRELDMELAKLVVKAPYHRLATLAWAALGRVPRGPGVGEVSDLMRG